MTKLNTSFVERLNLTIRQGSAYLFRRTIYHARWKEPSRRSPGVASPLPLVRIAIALCGFEGTVTAGGSSLTQATDQYTYVRKTNTAWKNTCRTLSVKLNDGTTHSANFRFK